MSPASRSQIQCPFSASPERGLVWISAGRKGQFQLALPISSTAATDPIHEILGTPPRKRCLPLRGRIVHFLAMRDRLPCGSKCSIVSKTGALMRNALQLRGPQRFEHRMPPCRVSTKKIWKPSSTQLRLKPSILSISGLSPPGTSIGD